MLGKRAGSLKNSGMISRVQGGIISGARKGVVEPLSVDAVSVFLVDWSSCSGRLSHSA